MSKTRDRTRQAGEPGKGKASKGERTRARLVDAAATLLRRQGYHGTALSEIVAVSGAPRGSLYFHFPDGKEALASEALARSGGEWQARLEAVIDATPDLPTAVRAVCTALADTLVASDFDEGCPLAAAALEATAATPLVRDTCAAHFGHWIDTIEARLHAAGFGPDEAHRLALLALSTIEGATMLSKVRRDPEPLRVAGAMLAELVAARRA